MASVLYNNHKYDIIPNNVVKNDSFWERILSDFNTLGPKVKYPTSERTLYTFLLKERKVVLMYEKTSQGVIENRMAILLY